MKALRSLGFLLLSVIGFYVLLSVLGIRPAVYEYAVISFFIIALFYGLPLYLALIGIVAFLSFPADRFNVAQMVIHFQNTVIALLTMMTSVRLQNIN